MHRCLPIPACHRPTAPSWRLAHSAPRTPRLASLQRGRGRASDRVPVTRHSLLACATACELVCRRTAASHQGPRCFCELSSQQSLQVRQVRCECAGPRCRPVANCSPAAPAVRCTGPYHLMYVCVYSAVGSHQQRTWMAGSHPPSMRMRGCVPPARAPPRTMSVCAACALGAGALPHSLQQRCSCVKCISVPRLCCRHVWCVRHTHLLGQHHHHVAGVHVAGVAGPCAASLLQCSWVPTT